MIFCIGFGEFNKKFFYILAAILCKLIAQLIIGLDYSILEPINPAPPINNIFCIVLLFLFLPSLGYIIHKPNSLLLFSKNSASLP